MLHLRVVYRIAHEYEYEGACARSAAALGAHIREKELPKFGDTLAGA